MASAHDVHDKRRVEKKVKAEAPKVEEKPKSILRKAKEVVKKEEE